MLGKCRVSHHVLSGAAADISRHYVAFVRKKIPEEGNQVSWVLFNDEKVVKAVDVEEMKKFAYVYFFRRI